MTGAPAPGDTTALRSCFVFGFALDGRGGGTALDGPSAEHGPLWLHLDYSAGDAERWLSDLGLDANVVESLIRTDTRPRTVTTNHGTLVVLRGINTNPGADPEDMVSLRLWIERDRVITVRQRRLLAVQDIRDYLAHGHGPPDLPALVIALAERLADRIVAFVDDIEGRQVEFETAVEADDPSRLRSRVAALRRQTAVVRRFLAPQREALEALSRVTDGLLDEEGRYAVRDQSDRIVRAVEDLDLVRERALVVQEELLNRISQEQNARMYVLSIVAAIFLPITFISGVFGMNTAGLPGMDHPLAFWGVAGAMAATSVVVITVLRKKRWL